jgi:hypothetical protein
MARKVVLVVLFVFSMSACSGGVSVLLDSLQGGDIQDGDGTTVVPDVVSGDLGIDIPALDSGLELLFPEVVEDLGSLCDPGDGCFLDPCGDGEECLSGWCVEHMGEGVCTQQCTTECPPGWSCQQVAGTAPDLVFVCVSDHANLCRPCATGDNCKSVAGAEDVCVDYGDEGSFCGGTCTVDGDCPWGFSCAATQTVDGIETKQCVADAGNCPCTKKAVDLALWTPCEATNEFGTCPGKRICTEEGLAPCDSMVPAPEVCDGLDNDCDGETDNLLCDDDNACTKDLCDAEIGCTNEPLEGTSCDDGDVCTLADHCEAGTCVGSVIDCDDGNLCTDDECNPTGGCAYTDNQVDCDDGDPCTVKDTCAEGSCSGYQTPCDCQENSDCGALEDGDQCNGTLYCDQSQVPYQCAVSPESIVECEEPTSPCLAAVCDPSSGGCGTIASNEGGGCQDGSACTVGDQCGEGECIPGPAVNCNDGNPCTTDLCDPATGCFHENNALPCNDGSACTTGDLCQEGDCLGLGVLECDDGNVCTDDGCDSANGCVATPNDALCDDGNSCTVTDQCAGGLCLGTGALGCDDENICTTDSCDPATGCVQVANKQPCDDGDACTVGDLCGNGACMGKGVLDCEDGNLCTDDSCDAEAGCVHEFNQAPCDDLNTCTTDDACNKGKCLGIGSLECDDGNPCTKDICLPEGGCQHEAAAGACDDDDPCTVNDVCDEGECVSGVAPDCDDENPCTDDSCVAGLCVHTPNDSDCDDSNACTLDDLCAQGKCVPGVPLDCDDGNICTTDSCVPDNGCTNANNTQPCDDGDACTLKDVCAAGQCVGAGDLNCNDGNICTNDSCNSETGCITENNADNCFDGDVCTTGDVCDAGVCGPTGSLDCDDANPCTDDSCDPKIGCVHVSNAAPCDDGNGCTTGDTCKAGQCVGGAPPNCEDDDACTTESCSPDSGCVYTLNTAPCDDGEVCTINDKCNAGACLGGETLPCNDSNLCTTDACVPGVGCQFVNNTVKCDDSNACTTLDVCAGGECVGSTPPNCDDSNVCTDDSCNAETGCVNANNTAGCDDSNACTTSDTCAAGSCVGGPALDCDDSNACTADSCNTDTGCVHVQLVCCGNGVKDAGEACDDGNQVGGDGCSADCKTVEYKHNNGQGKIWYNGVPTGTLNTSQAKLSCQQTYGTCYYTTNDCAGPGWCQGNPGGKCWGWTSGCSGGAGRVWQYSSSYTTYGTWN